MEIWAIKCLMIVSIIIVDIIWSIIPIYFTAYFTRSNNVSKINCVMAGILLSTSLMQLLADASNTLIIPSMPKFSLIHLISLLGFICTLFLEWGILIIKSRREYLIANPKLDWLSDSALPHLDILESSYMEMDEEDEEKPEIIEQSKYKKVWDINNVLMIIIFMESITTGLTFAFQKDFGDVVTFFITIISTDWIESIIITTSIINTSRTKNFKRIIIAGLLHSIVIPIGFGLGMIFDTLVQEKIIIILSTTSMAFTSGSFIAISTISILADEIRNTIPPDDLPNPFAKTKQILTKMAFTTLGFLFSISIIFLMDIK